MSEYQMCVEQEWLVVNLCNMQFASFFVFSTSLIILLL